MMEEIQQQSPLKPMGEGPRWGGDRGAQVIRRLGCNLSCPQWPPRNNLTVPDAWRLPAALCAYKSFSLTQMCILKQTLRRQKYMYQGTKTLDHLKYIYFFLFLYQNRAPFIHGGISWKGNRRKHIQQRRERREKWRGFAAGGFLNCWRFPGLELKKNHSERGQHQTLLMTGSHENSHSLLLGMQPPPLALEDSWAVSDKTKYTLPIRSSRRAPWYLLRHWKPSFTQKLAHGCF